MPVTGKHASELRAVQQRVTEKALTRAALAVLAEAQKTAPVDEGPLRRSLTWGLLGSSPASMRARVGSNLKYSVWVSRGTKPHVIRPKSGRKGANGRPAALRFPSKGGVVFAKVVKHPGTKANEYLVKALGVLKR